MFWRRKRKGQPGVPPRPVGVGDFSAEGHDRLIRELRSLERGDTGAAPSLDALAMRFGIRRVHLDEEIDELCAHNRVERGSPGWVDRLRFSPRLEPAYLRGVRKGRATTSAAARGTTASAGRWRRWRPGRASGGNRSVRCWLCGEPIVRDELATSDGQWRETFWRHRHVDPSRVSAWSHRGGELVGPDPPLVWPPVSQWRRPGTGGSGDREPRHPRWPTSGSGAALEPPTE
jgi:hypothetical protein